MADSFAPAAVAPRLLAWYGVSGRDLPWRGTRDPYRIWLSEIMLQQTTVAAAIPYYQRFLATFPTLADLAAAPSEAVIARWAGLGYYSRARNLHRTAQLIAGEHGGRFPETVAGLMTLPGIGRSTAGAILSIAFDRPAPILDGNVRRVLIRLAAIGGDPRAPATERRLWQLAELLTPPDRPHDYAQAIMDLGATVCTPQAPACDGCPLAELCAARRTGLADQLPEGRKRPAVPLRRQVALLVRSGERLLARRRPPQGFLGGLWELPVADRCEGETAEAAAGRLAAELGLGGELAAAGELRHAYSHFTLQLALFTAFGTAGARAGDDGWQWLTREQLRDEPFHGAHRKALERFGGADHPLHSFPDASRLANPPRLR